MTRIRIDGPIVSKDDAWIYDFFGMSCTCLTKISDALSEANGDDVVIEINSPGGDVFEATDIYERIRGYDGNLKIKVIFAASAASIIACAAKSEISPTGMIMIHNVSSYAEGDYRDMSHESEVLLKASQAVSKAYELKTGMTQKELISLMDKETYLTADEAVKLGFIDEISNPEKSKSTIKLAAAMSGLLPEKTIKKMQNQKAKLKCQLDLLSLRRI